MLSTFALALAGLLSVAGWNHVQSYTTGERQTPLLFHECRPIHEGIVFEKNVIRVEKIIAFCNPVVEHEKIPPRVVIDLGNGQFVSPSEETATTAIFPVTFKDVVDKDWHVIAKE